MNQQALLLDHLRVQIIKIYKMMKSILNLFKNLRMVKKIG